MTIKQLILKVTSSEKNAQSVSNSNFTVNFNDIRLLNVTSVILKSFTCDNNFYNINQNNNVLNYVENGVDATLTVPPGQYTVDQLIAYLQGTWGLNQNGTITIHPNSKMLIWGADFNIVILQSSTILNVLGLPSAGISTTSPYSSTELPRLGVHKNIYIRSNTLSDRNLIGATNIQNIYAVIPNESRFGFPVAYNTTHHDIDVVNYGVTKNIQSIDVGLVDILNNPLEINGGAVTMILKVFYLA